MYASDSSYGTLPANVFVYYAMTYCFGYEIEIEQFC